MNKGKKSNVPLQREKSLFLKNLVNKFIKPEYRTFIRETYFENAPGQPSEFAITQAISNVMEQQNANFKNITDDMILEELKKNNEKRKELMKSFEDNEKMSKEIMNLLIQPNTPESSFNMTPGRKRKVESISPIEMSTGLEKRMCILDEEFGSETSFMSPVRGVDFSLSEMSPITPRFTTPEPNLKIPSSEMSPITPYRTPRRTSLSPPFPTPGPNLGISFSGMSTLTPSFMTPPKSGKCPAEKKDGVICNRSVMPGNTFCGLHKNKECL
jgi:hypothetical protein